jgi:hypothetical protein
MEEGSIAKIAAKRKLSRRVKTDERRNLLGLALAVGSGLVIPNLY